MPEKLNSSLLDKPCSEGLTEVSKANPCPHCGKSDWCYSLGSLTCCKRDADPAQGFYRTNKTDSEGHYYYAREDSKPQKAERTTGRREFIYTDTEGNPTVKVVEIRPGRKGKSKDIYQDFWGGEALGWVKAKALTKEQKDELYSRTTWYNYAEFKKAIAEKRPIIIVEGEGVAEETAEKVSKLGATAITAIGGAGKYRKHRDLSKDLAGAEDLLILSPDGDQPGVKHMLDIAQDFPSCRWLLNPCSDWGLLPKSGGLDLKDWIIEGVTAEKLLEAVIDREKAEQLLNRAYNAPSAQRRSRRRRPLYDPENKMLEAFTVVREYWGDILRYNTKTKCCELDGKRILEDEMYILCGIDIGIGLSKNVAIDVVTQVAKEKEYDPFKEYLDSLPHGDAIPVEARNLLDNLAQRYFGTSDALHQALIKRTLIAAVARTYQPGCKHDTITILQGKQGVKKSTFWEVLAGEGNFTDDLSGTSKDEIMKLSKYTIIEYAEFETAYKKKEVSELKAFLSRRSDSVRLPYGKAVKDVPRPSIFVGTTNKDEFLHDPTGERRYWVIPVLVDKKIDIDLLKKERDLIWGLAKTLYQQGEQWWLTEEESALQVIANGDYSSTDTWEIAIDHYIQEYRLREVTIANLLERAIVMPLERQKKSEQMRVAEILKRWGWTKGKKKRLSGNRNPMQVWIAPNNEGGNTRTQGNNEVATEVTTQSNPYSEKDSSDNVPTFPTFNGETTQVQEKNEPVFSETKNKSFNKVGENTPNIKGENLTTGEFQDCSHQGVVTSENAIKVGDRVRHTYQIASDAKVYEVVEVDSSSVNVKCLNSDCNTAPATWVLNAVEKIE